MLMQGCGQFKRSRELDTSVEFEQQEQQESLGRGSSKRLKHLFSSDASDCSTTSDYKSDYFESKDDGQSPTMSLNDMLRMSAHTGNCDQVQAALIRGADVNSVDASGNTPLIETVLTGHTEVVQMLIACGANINQANVHGITPILVASSHGCTEMVQGLVRCGADLNHTDEVGNTPLARAASLGCLATVQVLLKANADTNIQNVDGQLADDQAVRSSHQDVAYMIRHFRFVRNDKAQYRCDVSGVCG